MRFDKKLLISVAITVFLLIPFINKAFHIDDPLFLWTAKNILNTSFNFYGFSINWYGNERSMAAITKNPPLSSYYIALVGSLFGFNETVLHLAFFLFAASTAIGIYYLAARLCARPVIAVLASIATPVFLVSSTNIMCDIMMLAFWVWAIFLWMLGIETKSNWLLFFSSITIALCAFTKYFGVSLLVLLPVYTVAQTRKIGKELFFLLIPMFLLAGYQWLTLQLYGHLLFFDAMAYSTKQGWTISSPIYKVLTGLCFTGGCMLTVMFYSPLLWSKRILLSGAVLTILLILILGLMGKTAPSPSGTIDIIKWIFLIQFSIWVVVGGGVLLLTYEDFRQNKDSGSLLLTLWILGTFIFAVFFNWTINGRSVLPMVPAIGIFLARRIGKNRNNPISPTTWRIFLPLAPAVCISLCVCLADYSLANTARDAAAAISQKFASSKRSVWFQGHWGFQYYMQAAGCKALDFKKNRTKQGDIVVIPLNNTNIKSLPFTNSSPDTIFSFAPILWCGTMSRKLNSGFYSDWKGPAPFIFGPMPKEEYMIFIVH